MLENNNIEEAEKPLLHLATKKPDWLLIASTAVLLSLVLFFLWYNPYGRDGTLPSTEIEEFDFYMKVGFGSFFLLFLIIVFIANSIHKYFNPLQKDFIREILFYNVRIDFYRFSSNKIARYTFKDISSCIVTESPEMDLIFHFNDKKVYSLRISLTRYPAYTHFSTMREPFDNFLVNFISASGEFEDFLTWKPEDFRQKIIHFLSSKVSSQKVSNY